MLLTPVVLVLAVAQIAGPPAPAATAPAGSERERYEQCLDLATSDPGQAERVALEWRVQGGQYRARQCRAVAYANLGRWAAAAGEFEGAATEAELAHDAAAARYWAQAGNSWLAGGQAMQARTALDAALASGNLQGLQLGEAQFDRARTFVALGKLGAARTDIDQALKNAGDDPLIWLASAALARRMGDLPRARSDVAAAFDKAPEDAATYLEIGNIAAASGDEAGAQAAWKDAIRFAPASEAAGAAREALKQFDTAATDPEK